MRKLATLRHIAALNPIPGADAIETATVDGWSVVVKKGEFKVGDPVIYFEIDSILPEGREEFAFLMTKGVKDLPTDEGGTLRGYRLRTIRLRGQISQGLVIPLPEEIAVSLDSEGNSFILVGLTEDRDIDSDLSDIFGVKKYEKPIPASLAGKARGNYPSWLPKTDQERVQNCFGSIPTEDLYVVEEKIEGSSMTVYWDGEKVGVTSRNLDLILEQEGNAFVDTAKASGLVDLLEKVYAGSNVRVAIRGELIGPGIQGNIYMLPHHRFICFDVFEEGRYLNPQERGLFIDNLVDQAEENFLDLFEEVPVVTWKFDLSECSLQDLIDMADGRSLLGGTIREGLVFKSHSAQVFSFKAISQAYLLAEK